MNNDTTCRSCLEEQIPMTSLYEAYLSIDANTHLNIILKNIAKIEVNPGDGLPDKICELCLGKLKTTYKFICQVQDSDKTLRSIETLDVSVKSESFLEEYTANNKLENQKLVNSNSKVDNSAAEHDYSNLKANNSCDKTVNNLIVYNDSIQNVQDCKLEDEDSPPEIIEGSEEEEENDFIKLERIENIKTNSCEICNREFKTKNSLKVHIQKLHELEYKCDHCEKSFFKKMHLNVHMRAHFTDDQKPFTCEECGAKYAYKYQLTQHLYKHTDKKPFTCVKCNKGCVTADSYRRHMRTHSKNYKKSKHVCKDCGKEFSYPSFLAEHMKNHTGERPFLCPSCGKRFRQKGALTYHLRTHQEIRPFQCEICKDSFVSGAILKVHMRKHTNERPYVCDVCGRGFKQSSDCKVHRRIHFGLKLVECNVCKKKMSTTGQLTVHMRSHTGEKPFSCPHCYKTFATRTMVVKHVRIHTGEKPYMCNVCGKAFSQSNSLNIHLKIHTRTKESKENTQIVLVKMK